MCPILRINQQKYDKKENMYMENMCHKYTTDFPLCFTSGCKKGFLG